MLGDIISILMIIIISFIPILLWGYFFWYIDNDNFNKKRFFVWILAWSISVVPVLYLWDFISSLNLDILNIFSVIASFSDLSWVLKVFISFLSILFLLSILPYTIFYLTPVSKDKLKIFFYRFLIFSLYFLIFSFWFYFLNILFENIEFLQISTKAELSFWDVIFNSFKLVIFYYLLIAILEEISKFFFFSYSKPFSILSSKEGVIYAIFIALGFAFVENILYFKSLYENYWFWGELISTYFLRNIFSVFLHILCSSIFAYYFSILYLKFKNNFNFEFIKILFFWLVFSVFFHAIFDIFLTFDLTFFVFLYIIWWYFYLTYIFYKE